MKPHVAPPILEQKFTELVRIGDQLFIRTGVEKIYEDYSAVHSHYEAIPSKSVGRRIIHQRGGCCNGKKKVQTTCKA